MRIIRFLSILCVVIFVVITINSLVMAQEWMEAENGEDIYRVSGKIGIGTENPDAKLDVTGGDLYIQKDFKPALRLKDIDENNYFQFEVLPGAKLDLLSNNGSGEISRLSIDSNGNIGVGTKNPLSKLDINGYVRISTNGNWNSHGLCFSGQGGVETASFFYRGVENWLELNIGAAEASYLRIHNDSPEKTGGILVEGRAGIGTTSPGAKLHIMESDVGITENSATVLAVEKSRGAAAIQISTDNNQSGFLMFGDPQNNNMGWIRYNHDDDSMRFKINAKEGLTIINSGDVGINMPNPEERLHVNGDILLPNQRWIKMEKTDGWNEGILSLDNNNTVIIRDAAGGIQFQRWEDDHWEDTLIIDTHTGNVGIGTRTPDQKLYIKGQHPKISVSDDGTGNTPGLLFENQGIHKGEIQYVISEDRIRFMAGNTTDENEHMTITASGKVGIGTTNPSYKLEVNGEILTTGLFKVSDERLKKNVSPIDHALEKVSALQGVEFEWRSEDFPERDFGEKRGIGLIAQEVEKVIPEVVSIDDEGYKSIEYANMVGLLVEAIKELKTENEELRARIQMIEDRY